MNSRQNSAQRNASSSSSIPSLRRRWSAPSNAEEGNDVEQEMTEQVIVEEIEEIKRYEVCVFLCGRPAHTNVGQGL
jgi:hypothetical protein